MLEILDKGYADFEGQYNGLEDVTVCFWDAIHARLFRLVKYGKYAYRHRET